MSKSKGISTPLLIGGGVALWLLLKPGSGPVQTAPIQTGTGLIPIPSAPTQGGVPTTYGINAGNRIISNYNTLLAVNPNLGNPNYQMTASEAQQYLSNYIDLQQGLPSWIGHKQGNGVTPGNLQQAAQVHWTVFGCAEKRIFLPLQPPSSINYVPPVINPKASGGGGGSSWIGPALQITGTVLAAVLGVNSEPQLNDAEAQMLITGGAIINDLLPMYLNDDPISVKLAQNKLDDLINQYT